MTTAGEDGRNDSDRDEIERFMRCREDNIHGIRVALPWLARKSMLWFLLWTTAFQPLASVLQRW